MKSITPFQLQPDFSRKLTTWQLKFWSLCLGNELFVSLQNNKNREVSRSLSGRSIRWSRGHVYRIIVSKLEERVMFRQWRKRFFHRTRVAYGSVASSVFQKQLLTPFSNTFCRRWSWEAIKEELCLRKKSLSDLRLQPTSIAEINLRVQFRFVSIPVVPTWHSRAWATLTNAQANLSKPWIQKGRRINFSVFIVFRFIESEPRNFYTRDAKNACTKSFQHNLKMQAFCRFKTKY